MTYTIYTTDAGIKITAINQDAAQKISDELNLGKIISQAARVPKKTTIRQGTFCLIDSLAQCILFRGAFSQTLAHAETAIKKGKIPVMRYQDADKLRSLNPVEARSFNRLFDQVEDLKHDPY